MLWIGILVGHYSANTTSALFILNELFKLGEDKSKQPNFVLSEEQAKTFAGLIAAEYHRSAFHSPEEVCLGSLPYLERLKLPADLPKGEFENHLKNTIPALLPHDNDEYTKLTQNAIEMMGDASTLKLAKAIYTLASEVANEPDAEFPEEKPMPLCKVKENAPGLFKAFKAEYQGINEPSEEEKSPGLSKKI